MSNGIDCIEKQTLNWITITKKNGTKTDRIKKFFNRFRILTHNSLTKWNVKFGNDRIEHLFIIIHEFVCVCVCDRVTNNNTRFNQINSHVVFSTFYMRLYMTMKCTFGVTTNHIFFICFFYATQHDEFDVVIIQNCIMKLQTTYRIFFRPFFFFLYSSFHLYE